MESLPELPRASWCESWSLIACSFPVQEFNHMKGVNQIILVAFLAYSLQCCAALIAGIAHHFSKYRSFVFILA